jgi:hypothetical protein
MERHTQRIIMMATHPMNRNAVMTITTMKNMMPRIGGPMIFTSQLMP